MSSYEKIDYRIRPAKQAERLMLSDVLRRLHFASPESYQYVGLGSVFFADFALFHKALGFLKMVSIEREVADTARFEFNRPFSNIDLLWGTTAEVLPKINLTLRTIAWLDYDEPLNVAMLNDISHFVTNAPSGSVLIVSMQCNVPAFDASDPKKHTAELTERLGRGRVDAGLRDDALVGEGLARLFRRIVVNEIAAALASRNGVLPATQQISFEQVVNFRYADGAQMLTLGGVLFDRGQSGLFTACTFQDLDFVRTGEDSFRIGIPKLTLRELRAIEEQLPLVEGKALECGAMPPNDARKFAKIYRYFPNFTPVDL